MKKIILSLLVACLSLGGYAQDVMPDKIIPLNLTCTDCDLVVKIIASSETTCNDGNVLLELEIEGTYDKIEWEGNGQTHTGTTWEVPKETGIYTVKLTSGAACTATATFDTEETDSEVMKKFFTDNCFVSIPVEYDNIGGDGLRGNPTTSRNNGLVVEIKGLGTVDIKDLFAFSFAGLDHRYSTECEGYADGLSAYVGGAAVAWAHVIPNKDNTTGTLYLGVNSTAENQFGQAMVDAYFDFFEAHKLDPLADALSAPIDYICGSGQFLESKFGKQWIDYLLSVLECESYDPKEVGKGIIPFCLWEKAPEPLDLYGIDDIPFTAGLIDGGYQMIQDVGELIKLLKTLTEFSTALGNYLPCHLIGLDEEFYERLEDKLTTPDQLEKAKGLLNKALQYTAVDCEESIKTLNKIEDTLTKIYAFISDWEKVMMAYAAIQEKLSAYYKEITTCNDLLTCNNARYEHGKLAINVASIVVGVGVEEALFKSFTYLAKIVDNIPINQLGDFFTFITTKTNKLKRLSPAQKAIFEDASGVLPPSAWGKLVDDAELLEVWAKLRRLPCNVLARNGPNGCEELLIEVFGTRRAGELIKDFGKDADNVDFWNNLTRSSKKEELVKAWESVLKEGIDDAIRTNTEYLEVISRFPFKKGTSRVNLLDHASKRDFEQIYSGKLVAVKSDDQNAVRLSQRYGGQPEVRFDTDPVEKEFDVITGNLIIEHKGHNSPSRPGTMGGQTKIQVRIGFEASIATNRSFILHVDGPIDKNNYLSNFEEIVGSYPDVNYKFYHNDILLLNNF